MKRLLSLILALLLVTGALSLAACGTKPSETATDRQESATGEPGTQKETDSASESAESGSESATESGSESVTESGTESQTETATETEPESKRYTDEELESIREELNRTTVGNKLPIASFGAIVKAEKMQEVYELMLEAGINTVIAVEAVYSTTGEGNWLDLVLSSARETGMDVILSAQGFDGATMESKLLGREEYFDLIKAIYLKDEPTPDQFGGLAETRETLRKYLPGADKWQMGANLLPFGSGSYEAGNEFDFETAGYEDTLRKYMDTVHPEFLCFDYYPWTSGGSIQYYLTNLLLVEKVAKDYDVPTYTFIEANSIDVSYYQLKLECNLSLASGAQALYLFLAKELGHFSAGVVFDTSGNVTNWNYYSCMEEIFNGLHAMKGVFLDFDWQNNIFAGKAVETYTPMLNKNGVGGFINEGGSFGELTSVESPDAVIGCFTDQNGVNGLYVVNTNLDAERKSEDTVLHFGEEVLYEIWGEEGLEKIGYAETLTLSLYAGDGKFIVINPTLPQ